MVTYTDLITRSYQDVQLSPGILTDQFLEATDGLVAMFDLFQAPAFSVVQNDIRGNVQKIRARYVLNTSAQHTLEALLALELLEPAKPKATEALLWLASLLHPQQELATSFQLAYDSSLRPHHSFLVRPVFQLAMKSLPYRQTFYESIGVQTKEQVQEMQTWIHALKLVVAKIQTHLKDHPEYTNRL
ncbi:glycolipid transfer protein [Hesseltinella vesiculosa]|uniref:Glycolipid transfer protein n=1 Tax=Hesseltinella vesiculosa TaxID=101127 RepID=A0A1X2G3P9_9FUNG|nr:glycolipid transfer protein [Hesseltinella vesiculosa]